MSNYRFITASDSNPTYCGFIPSWISHHKKLYPESEVKVILVSDTLPNNLNKCKEDIILFKPLKDMQTSYQAQLVRMVYGALLTEKQNIICDMDMYILNKDLLEMFDRIPNKEDRYINYGCLFCLFFLKYCVKHLEYHDVLVFLLNTLLQLLSKLFQSTVKQNRCSCSPHLKRAYALHPASAKPYF